MYIVLRYHSDANLDQIHRHLSVSNLPLFCSYVYHLLLPIKLGWSDRLEVKHVHLALQVVIWQRSMEVQAWRALPRTDRRAELVEWRGRSTWWHRYIRRCQVPHDNCHDVEKAIALNCIRVDICIWVASFPSSITASSSDRTISHVKVFPDSEADAARRNYIHLLESLIL